MSKEGRVIKEGFADGGTDNQINNVPNEIRVS